MKQYETLFICRPELTESEIGAVVDRLLKSIETSGGNTISIDEWGNRKLAYHVRYRGTRLHRGYYILMIYAGGGESVSEVERNIRLMDETFRYQTIKLSDDYELDVDAEMTHKRPTAPSVRAPASQPEKTPEQTKDPAAQEAATSETPAQEPVTEPATEEPTEQAAPEAAPPEATPPEAASPEATPDATAAAETKEQEATVDEKPEDTASEEEKENEE